MLIATGAVTLVPLVAIWGIRSSGESSSPWVCVPLAVAISLAISAAGSAYWKRRRPAPELVFSDLMLWNWLRRRRTERAIRDASGLLDGSADMSPDRRAHLLRQLAVSLDAQDPYTIGHSRRVARHSAMVARKLGLPAEQSRKVRAAAAIHDIGKLHVAPGILNKPGRLTDTEYELVKRHPDDGAREVSRLGDRQLTEIVRHHHERLDGSGYPAGLAGEDIPLGARIVAVADTFDAITSVRAYRPARPHKQALDILRTESGSQLDPLVVEAFIACYAGRRAVAAWATLSALPQTALAALGGSTKPPTQVRVSPTQALSTGATMAVVAGLAVAAPIAAHHRRRHDPPPARAVFAAAPILRVGTAPAPQPHRAAVIHPPASPFSPLLGAPAAPPTAAVHTQLARARTPVPGPHTGVTVPRAPATTPGDTPTGTTSTPPTTTRTTTTTTTTSSTPSTTAAPATSAPAPPPATTTVPAPAPPSETTTSTPSPPPPPPPTTTVASSTTTTTTTTPPDGDPCKDGGWAGLGYPNQGQCESEHHGHHHGG